MATFDLASSGSVAAVGTLPETYTVIATSTEGTLPETYTVIPVGVSDFSSLGLVLQHSNLLSSGSLPWHSYLPATYTVRQPPDLQTTLSPIQDAFVWERERLINYGDLEDLVVGRDAAASVSRSLIQFDLSSLPAGLIIKKAKIVLEPIQTDQQTVSAYPVLEPWEELGVTWQNQPRRAPSPIASAPVMSGPVEIDVTDLFKAWYTAERDNYGVVVLSSDEAQQLRSVFGARENVMVDRRPKLVATYLNPNATFDDVNLSSKGSVRLSSVDELSSSGTARASTYESTCWEWRTVLFGLYEDVAENPIAADWQIPSKADLFAQTFPKTPEYAYYKGPVTIYVGSKSFSFTRRISVSWGHWHTFNVTLRPWEMTYVTYYQAARGYYVKDLYVPGYIPAGQGEWILGTYHVYLVFRVYVWLIELDMSGGCAVIGSGVASVPALLSGGDVRQVSHLPSVGSVGRHGVSLFDAIGHVSRYFVMSSGLAKVFSEIVATGRVPVHGSSEMISRGTVRRTGYAFLGGRGYVAHAPNEISSTGWVDAKGWLDLATAGQVGRAPNQVPSQGSVPWHGEADLPSSGHVSSPWMRARGEVRQISSLWSRGMVLQPGVPLPSRGEVLFRGQSELPSSGWPAIRDASDLLSIGQVGGGQSDLASRGVAKARRFSVILEVQLWPPQGRTAFPS